MQQSFNDYDIDDAIHNRERNYKLFLKIVGKNPLDQIDWIVEHGLDKFNYWFRCYETGKIYSPATVEEYKPPYEKLCESVFEVRGGTGNNLLLSLGGKMDALETNLRLMDNELKLISQKATLLEMEIDKRYK